MVEAITDTPQFDAAESVLRQEEIYAAADTEIWRRAVYAPLHDGWELACIGGREFLNYIARDARLGPATNALELGSGAGAAAEYLSAHTDAHVTGIERNAAQHDRALSRARSNPRLSFARADVADWRPGGQEFEAVFLLDTLSLVPDWDGFLRAARRALPQGRALYIADQSAGPAVRRSTLERAYSIDGFVGLRPVEELHHSLERAGFTEIGTEDDNARAIASFTRIHDTTRAMAKAPESEEFVRVLEAWIQLTGFYLTAFRQRELVYSWTRAA